jgi:hypothetical protein
MEFNNSIIITVLLVIIVILIFSNITFSMGSSSDYTQNQQYQPQQYQDQLSRNNTRNPTQTPSVTKMNYKNDVLLSNDVKKQLNILNDQFYLNNCKI